MERLLLWGDVRPERKRDGITWEETVMKNQTTIWMLMGMLAAGTLVAQQKEDAVWASPHVADKVTQTIDQDESGTVQGATVVHESRIALQRVVTEVQKRDETGQLRVVSRTTETTNTIGNKEKVVEQAVKGYSDIVVVSVTRLTKTPTTETTTTETRNAAGELALTRRVMTTIESDGSKKTVVETADASGTLSVRQYVAQY